MDAQGCDAEGGGQWVDTDEADAWAAERKWPQDPMWTESTWPNSSPSFVLYQVRHLLDLHLVQHLLRAISCNC